MSSHLCVTGSLRLLTKSNFNVEVTVEGITDGEASLMSSVLRSKWAVGNVPLSRCDGCQCAVKLLKRLKKKKKSHNRAAACGQTPK